ncbi:MAG: hypothetical protein MUE97_03085 [Phycisphaerales bacterium]|jgi:hypothetical protein|nr:hypothetical protein [Phycisphaerales bacterium]
MKSIFVSRGIAAGVVAVSVASLSAVSQAAILNVGASQFPVANEGPITGTIVGTLTTNFSTSLYGGTLSSEVISGDTTNPLGGLTFVYTLSNFGTSTSSLSRLTLNGFVGIQTDTSWFVGSPRIIPAAVDRTSSPDVIGWSWLSFGGNQLIGPNSSSSQLIVQTNATSFNPNVASIIDGLVTQSGILAPIPTPGAAALLGLGGLVMAGRRRGR